MCCGADVATCRVAYESTRTIITAMSTYMTSLGSARLGVCATKQPPPPKHAKARKSPPVSRVSGTARVVEQTSRSFESWGIILDSTSPSPNLPTYLLQSSPRPC
ncbi:hypothetical protein PMIN07_012648 [Paraphaeosphaeria minitans]